MYCTLHPRSTCAQSRLPSAHYVPCPLIRSALFILITWIVTTRLLAASPSSLLRPLNGPLSEASPQHGSARSDLEIILGPINHTFDDKFALPILARFGDFERFQCVPEFERVREEGFEVDEALGDEVDREGAASVSLLPDGIIGAY